MSTAILLVQLDGAVPGLLQRWDLPNLRAVRRSGTACEVSSRSRYFPYSYYSEFNTGRSVARSGFFSIGRQFHAGASHLPALCAADLPAEQQFWSVASRHGRNVAVVDPALGTMDGSSTQLLGWSVHEQFFGPLSRPSTLLQDAERRWGSPRLAGPPGRHGCLRQSRDQLAAILGQEAARKRRVAVELLASRTWDLFVIGFTELHCAGHLLWHHHDEAKRAGVDGTTRDPLYVLYRQLDDQIGGLIEAAGADATVMIASVGAIGPASWGPRQMLPQMLDRLGFGSESKQQLRLQRILPRGLRRTLSGNLPLRWRRHLSPNTMRVPTAGARTRVFALENYQVGALRLNLVGREPRGTVLPGSEAEAMLEELRRELGSWRDLHTGKALVEELASPHELFGPGHHADLPDLLVCFRTDLPRVETLHSDRLGAVTLVQPSTPFTVTGDHLGHTALIARGLGARLGPCDLLDIPATILDRLDVDLPPWFDGRPLRELPLAEGELRHEIAICGNIFSTSTSWDADTDS